MPTRERIVAAFGQRMNHTFSFSVKSIRPSLQRVTKQSTYDEREGFWPWNYVTCREDIEGQEVWRINVKVKRVDEVVIPLVAADHNHGLVQVAERELGARMMAEHLAQG